MLFEKGTDYVEITDGLVEVADGSTTDNEVWCINTNIVAPYPEEFKGIIRKSDTNGFENLKNFVLDWAGTNKFKRIQIN